MTLAIQSLQRTLSFCAFETTNDVTQWWHLMAGVWFILTQSLQSWNNLIKLWDLTKTESIPVILQLYTWTHLVKKCAVRFPVLNPVSSLLFPFQSRDCGGCGSGAQCLPKEKGLVRSFVPCSACRAGAPCSACAFCLLASNRSFK